MRGAASACAPAPESPQLPPSTSLVRLRWRIQRPVCTEGVSRMGRGTSHFPDLKSYARRSTAGFRRYFGEDTAQRTRNLRSPAPRPSDRLRAANHLMRDKGEQKLPYPTSRRNLCAAASRKPLIRWGTPAPLYSAQRPETATRPIPQIPPRYHAPNTAHHTHR